MSRFRIHDIDSAPTEAARDVLQKVKAARGYVTNLHGALAESALAVGTYFDLTEQFGQSDFSPVERQVIMMTVNRLTLAPYCMAAHSVRLEKLAAENEVIEALRSGQPLVDPRMEALRRFTEAVIYTRGRVNNATWTAFNEAGFGNQHALEVVMGVALKTFSNFASRMTEPPLDLAIEHCVWTSASADGVKPVRPAEASAPLPEPAASQPGA